MTTAHRPTYFAAIGKQDYGGVRSRMQSARDQVGHTKMKVRQFGQSTAEELIAKDLREELNRKEQEYVAQRNKGLQMIMEEEKKVDVPLLLKNQPELKTEEELRHKYDDADVDEGESDDGFDSSSDEDDDEDDDEAELQAELERIRQERELAQQKKLKEEEELAEMARRENALKSNPLAHIEDNSSKIKRKWNDDVVFRNQARDEPQAKKRFINDTIRSDFHRAFLKKYVK